MGVDDMKTAPGWIWIGFLGWIGTYLIYPVWSGTTSWRLSECRSEL